MQAKYTVPSLATTALPSTSAPQLEYQASVTDRGPAPVLSPAWVTVP
jgi:hypothetical protein